MRRIRSPCCARAEWPRRRRAAKKRDERAAPHSITSSARASTEEAIVERGADLIAKHDALAEFLAGRGIVPA
jgi:hypothetical protein